MTVYVFYIFLIKILGFNENSYNSSRKTRTIIERKRVRDAFDIERFISFGKNLGLLTSCVNENVRDIVSAEDRRTIGFRFAGARTIFRKNGNRMVISRFFLACNPRKKLIEKA